jgi:hypothetical protein
MVRLSLILCALAASAPLTSATRVFNLSEAGDDHVDLVTFGSEAGTIFDWELVKDPVKGDLSKGDFTISKEYAFALFNGTMASGGQCNAETKTSILHKAKFNAASGYTHLMIYYRSTAAYDGFKFSLHSRDSYKAGFNVTSDGTWRVAAIPFSDFSSGSKACSKTTSEACLTEKKLKDIEQVGLWAEGIAGAFNLQIKWIRAGYGDTCSNSEYCCPDAMKCLTPSKISCKGNPDACTGGAICCPLTELCVTVGNACTSACQAPWAEKALFCCPDAKACLAPTDPGVLCTNTSDCKQGHSVPVICCPLTNLCVTAADACQPGDPVTPSWWPVQ